MQPSRSADAGGRREHVHRLLIGGALATLLLPASAHADAEVRFLNAVPGDEEAGLRIVRGSRTVDTRTVPFAGVSGYARVPAGSVVLRMRPTKDGRPQPLRAGLRDGRSYMAVAVGPMDRPQLKLRPERDGQSGTALVRVVHMAPELGSPDLMVDGATVTRAFPYLAATPYTELEPGRHRFSAVNPRTGSTVLEASASLRDGTASSAYVVGGQGARTRTVLTRDGGGSSVAGVQVRSSSRSRSAREGRAVHVVRKGECLWDIAERWLGSGASNAEIADEVKRLWELNGQDVASGDPDLILPGLRLRLR